MLSKIIQLLILGATLVTSPVSASEQIENRTYTFGIVPQQSASRLASDWGPLLLYIQNRSGVKLAFKTAPNIPEFESRLAKGSYDFSYMNPYHYTVFSNSQKYHAYAKVSNKRIKGIVVCSKSATIDSLEELSGETLSFPSPAAFAASLLTRAELNRRGVDFKTKFVNSHDSVYRTVAKGLFPCGGGIIRTYKLIDPKIREQLMILWTSPGHTPHAFAAHPSVPDTIVKRVANAMYEMSSDDEGKKLLERLGMKRLEPAIDSDWNDVRKLNLQGLDK